MFGDEPYGNYNRIMLGHVLAGEDAEEIYLNPLDWYTDNAVTLHAGVRVVRVTASRARSSPTRHDPALRQADHRDGQPDVLPADGRHVGRRPHS